jgi:hypothetical protein
MTGPRFAAQVEAAVSLGKAPTNHCKAPTVAKEVMAIMPGNKTRPPGRCLAILGGLWCVCKQGPVINVGQVMSS